MRHVRCADFLARSSDDIVADEYCGSDPFGKNHYTDEAEHKYLSPNPRRGTTDLWKTNAGIFQNFDTARNHLDAGMKNVEIGYPAILPGGRLGVWRRAGPKYPEDDRGPAHQPTGA